MSNGKSNGLHGSMSINDSFNVEVLYPVVVGINVESYVNIIYIITAKAYIIHMLVYTSIRELN